MTEGPAAPGLYRSRALAHHRGHEDDGPGLDEATRVGWTPAWTALGVAIAAVVAMSAISVDKTVPATVLEHRAGELIVLPAGEVDIVPDASEVRVDGRWVPVRIAEIDGDEPGRQLVLITANPDGSLPGPDDQVVIRTGTSSVLSALVGALRPGS